MRRDPPAAGIVPQSGAYRYIKKILLSLVSGKSLKLGDTLTNSGDDRPARCMLPGEPACSSDV